MSDYKPVKGDRVRVVLEGEVEKRGDRESTGFSLQDETFYTGIDTEAPFLVSVEKIEPPVEVFKPGDVVRNTGYPEHVYTLGKDGYYSHMAEKFYKPCGPFTSADYELVYRP